MSNILNYCFLKSVYLWYNSILGDGDMIILAYDHGGYDTMVRIKQYLDSCGLEYIDVNNKYDEQDSYVEYAKLANIKMIEDIHNVGIYMCRSGLGMSIVANRQKGVRAVLCNNEKFAIMGRKHNDANVLVLPNDYMDFDTMTKTIDAFLNTEFEGGRHATRVQAIDEE